MWNPGGVLVDDGLVDVVNALRVSYLPSLRIGLFANDWNPTKVSTISEVVPAWFSGNTVLHNLPGWQAAFLDGDLAVSEATVRTWIHNGGSTSSWVFGYYVVDLTGKLVFAERTEQFGVIMWFAGQTFRVIPRFAIQSRYAT